MEKGHRVGQTDLAKAHTGHVNPYLALLMGKWLKSPQNTNHWLFLLHISATIFLFKEPKSPKSNQFGAVGGQIWSFGGEN
eukprot:785428-Pelagomonas_calceolata.AAC.2